MVVLVSGGAGFIGSHVCEALLKEGKQVICIDDLNDYYDPRYKQENIVALKSKNFVHYKADITNFSQIRSIFQKNKISNVVHLAARVGIRHSLQKPQLYEKTNILGTLHLLLLAKKYATRNFIFGSSSSVYGNSKAPFKEGAKTSLPLNPYAMTKLAGEMLCYSFSSRYEMSTTCLRFFSVYGPRGRPDMAPYIFTQNNIQRKEIMLFGDGTNRRDYTHVFDITQGILKALETRGSFETINLGNSKPISLSELIKKIEDCTGKKTIIKQQNSLEHEAKITSAHISKAKRLLNW